MTDMFQIIRLNEVSRYFSEIDKVDINLTRDDSSNLLHHAIAWGRIEIAMDLISRGININQQGQDGMTALQYAIEWDRKKLACAIIDAGADVNIRDDYGNNALWTAVFNARGDYELVQ